jgi:serine phosphatase RsbU (regulator of sigma subunit)
MAGARIWTRPRHVVLGLVVGVAVPFLVALVVPHDIPRVNVAMIPMLCGIVFAVLVGGIVAGVVSALVAGGVLTYWFFPPRNDFAVSDARDVVSLAMFFLVAVVFIVLLDRLVARATSETEQRVRSEAALQSEQRMVRQLQLAILPAILPRVEGVQLAARYIGATDGTRAGGDWYAVIPLGDDGLALAIGDVVGHGIGATALMAQMRHALQAFATIDPDPGHVLDRLNRLLLSSNPDALASVVYGVLDIPTRTWRQASAGHCWPAVRDPDATVHFLDLGHGPMLGLSADAKFPAAATTLAHGSVLALYTDGLIERRGELLDAGMARLADALRPSSLDLESRCDDMLRDLDRHDLRDDIALLVAGLD